MQITQREISARQAVDWGIIFAVVASLAIIAMGTWQLQFELAVQPADDPGFFYEWQLAEPTFLSRATAWIGFALHNLLVWMTIYWAQERSSRKYTDTLKPFNIYALIINAVFIVLHYAQTFFFYDAIAQDIPSWTAQGTVIMMLFVIIAMENRRRGIVFGKKVKFRKEFYHWLRDYHGYAFSFAVIYTFWFHPMVPTLGHIVGFLHVFLVMLQGSLMFTRLHLNKKWIVLLELLVLPHAALIAMNQSNMLLFMFVLGFLTMFVFTQMYALDFKPWLRRAFLLGYAGTVLFSYTVVREPFMVNEVIRIPFIEYGLVFVTYGLWWVFARTTGKLAVSKREDTPSAPATAGD